MASFSALETAKRGLLAQKFGFEVTNNNIQNVNTPGYSRRTAVISESSPMIKTKGGFIGTGSLASSLRTFREEIFDRDVRKSVAREASYNAEKSIYERIEGILAEPSENGINESVNKLFAAFEKASLNPQDVNLRENIIQTASTFVDSIHNTAGMFFEARKDLYKDINGNIDQANQLIEQISVLNKKIGYTKAEASVEAQSFVDERAMAIQELAKLTGAHATQDDRGQMNVFIDGINVITGADYSKLQLQENVNATTGETTLILNTIGPKGNINGTANPISGSLYSQMKAYNVTFDPNDSSGEYSVFSKINEFVDTLATKFNDLTVTGYGLNDTGNTPPARNFFLPDTATNSVTALNIQINPDIKNDSANLPLADVALEPGNNNIARQIARLANDSNFLNGQSPTGAYSSILGKIGMMSSESINGSKTMQLVVQQMESQRESLIGVNLDEEAVSLIKFQRAFEASSKVVNTTNEILRTIINLV